MIINFYMASPAQDNSSNDVSTLISEVTDQEVVIEDVNLQYVKVTLPSGKTVTKCLFCDKTWGKIVSKAKRPIWRISSLLINILQFLSWSD